MILLTITIAILVCDITYLISDIILRSGNIRGKKIYTEDGTEENRSFYRKRYGIILIHTRISLASNIFWIYLFFTDYYRLLILGIIVFNILFFNSKYENAMIETTGGLREIPMSPQEKVFYYIQRCGQLKPFSTRGLFLLIKILLMLVLCLNIYFNWQ